MTLTLSKDGKTSTVALRPDTAEYLLGSATCDAKDWRLKDLITTAWALAQQLKESK